MMKKPVVKNLGFTLIELMVAMSILVLIVGMLAQVFGGVTTAASAATRRLETNSQARAVLDRIGFDLQSRIRRGGVVPVFLRDSDGLNDSIAVVSDVRSAANARLGIVEYSVKDSGSQGDLNPDKLLGPDGLMLVRTVKAITFADHLIDVSDGTTKSPATLVTGGTEQVIGPGVFRLEIAFQLKSGTIQDRPPIKTGGTTPDWAQVANVVVGIAVLDRSTLDKYGSNSQLAAKLPDIPSSGQSAGPIEKWTLDGFGGAADGVVRQAIRFYQRSYPL